MNRWTAATALAAALFLSASARAEPHVTGVSGGVAEDGPVRVRGEGFGQKTPAAPLLFADFRHSLEPSNKGLKHRWDAVENMVWSDEGPQGSGCAKAADGHGRWALGVDHRYWTSPGSFAYVFRKQRMNFTVSDKSQNWKVWRLWPAERDGNYPNLYIAANNGRVYVEKIGQESGFWGSFPSLSLDWVNEELMLKASSVNEKDGVLIYKQNGAERADGNVMTSSVQAPNYMTRNFAVHAIAENLSRWTPGWSPANRIWVDDVYVDTTWSHVMLGDRPTPQESRHWEIQIPTAWTDTEITVSAHPGTFKSGETAYLYVFDADGHSNAHGYPVTIGTPLVADAHTTASGPLTFKPHEER